MSVRILTIAKNGPPIINIRLTIIISENVNPPQQSAYSEKANMDKTIHKIQIIMVAMRKLLS